MPNRTIDRLSKYIDTMPSLPVTVTKVIEICNNPRTSPADLNKVISLDPVLMGKVMKLINSAYYGVSQEITSLVRAIIMLGVNTVKNLALSTAVLGTLGTKDFQALNMEGFWRHSLCVGVTAKLIAQKRKVDVKRVEEFFIAGLLHDIGKIPLNNIFPTDYIRALAHSDMNHSSLYLSETAILEIDHTLSGGLIIEKWKLGEEIEHTIRYHHIPLSYDGPNRDLVYTIAAANFFANFFEIGFSGDRYTEKIPLEVLQTLGIDLDVLESLEPLVMQEIVKAQAFLNLAT